MSGPPHACVWGYVDVCGLAARPAEEAQNSVSGMNETAIHAKYIELVRLLFLFVVRKMIDDSGVTVCRVQTIRAGPCEGEAEVG